MYTVFIYYLLDTVSETILGSFEAKSEVMARRILDLFDFDKAKLSKSDCKVFKHLTPVCRLETYEEVVNSKYGKECSELLDQKIFDFEEQNNG